MIFPARKYTAEVLKPREQSLDFPAAQVTPELAAILCRRSAAVALVRRDQFDALVGQLAVEPVAVVGTIADQSLRFSSNVASVESVLDKGDFMRASSRRVNRDWK